LRQQPCRLVGDAELVLQLTRRHPLVRFHCGRTRTGEV
jgi:hypothetical protein